MNQREQQPETCAYEHCDKPLAQSQRDRNARLLNHPAQWSRYCSRQHQLLAAQQRRRKRGSAARHERLDMPFPGPGQTMFRGMVVDIAELEAAVARERQLGGEAPMIVSEPAFIADPAPPLDGDWDVSPDLRAQLDEHGELLLPEDGASQGRWKSRIHHA